TRRGGAPRCASASSISADGKPEFKRKKRVARRSIPKPQCRRHVRERRMTVARRMGAAEWGFLLALTPAWTGIFLLNRFPLAGLPPLTAVFLRLGLAAPLLLAVVYLQGDRLPRSSHASVPS